TNPSMVGLHDSVLIFLKSESFAQSLKKALEASGYRGTAATSESVALAEANANPPSLIILDRQSGAVEHFRRISLLRSVPIVAVQEGHLSCHEDECLKEYDEGTDLVVSGQSVRELVARVRAILRRRSTSVESNIRYTVGKLRMDLDRHEVLVSGCAVQLTPK